jgi:hypothetical protein
MLELFEALSSPAPSELVPLPGILVQSVKAAHQTSHKLGKRTTAAHHRAKTHPLPAKQLAPTWIGAHSFAGVSVPKTPAAQARHKHANAATAAGSDQPEPACKLCGDKSLFGAIGGANGAGSGAGVVAALSRFRWFVPSGGGRVRPDAPALGSPVDLAPLERPG